MGAYGEEEKWRIKSHSSSNNKYNLRHSHQRARGLGNNQQHNACRERDGNKVLSQRKGSTEPNLKEDTSS
jgi:hypothetical protein